MDLDKRDFIDSNNEYKGIKMVDPYQQVYRNMLEFEQKMEEAQEKFKIKTTIMDDY